MQQHNYPIKNMSEYNKVFKKRIIPTDRPGHNYYDANNVNFVDNIDNISTDTIVIDSASRNWNKENNNDYTINLGQNFQYVHSIELIDGYVPASGYIINNNNNLLYFQEHNDSPIIACVNPGNYNIKTLLKVLESSMNDSSQHHYKYKCILNQFTNKILISCDHHFNLIFTQRTEVVGDRGLIETMVINPMTNRKELCKIETSDSRNKYIDNSIGKILGFKPINLEGDNHYIGQMVYDLLPYKYLAIFVNTENHDKFDNIIAPSPDNGINGAFAIVSLLDNCYNCYNINKYIQVIDNGRYIQTFNPPISFNKLKIQFKTLDGSPYDFNGVDHHLVFEVKRIFNREVITSLQNIS